jgi:SAM-dependent methyltransferase
LPVQPPGAPDRARQPALRAEPAGIGSAGALRHPEGRRERYDLQPENALAPASAPALPAPLHCGGAFAADPPVIDFHHQGEAVRLLGGEAWFASGQSEAYRDTGATDLLEIVRRVDSGEPWRSVVAERYAQSYPWLHSIVTSPARDLFFRRFPPAPGARVLDIGSGWGQIALPLAARGPVTALEPTPERLAFIRAAARQDRVDANLCFVQADFLDVDFSTRFDLACCIGVLEWVPRFRQGEPRQLQVEFLARARKLLAPGGRLVVGIENRFGLKYLLGAADDHIGAAQVAVYDRELADRKWRAASGQPLRSFTYTRAELAEMLREAGFANLRFHAALPDYKLPEVLLPWGDEVNRFFLEGGFVAEHDGTNGAPLAIQDELRSHYRTLAGLGIAADFVPSFFVTAED